MPSFSSLVGLAILGASGVYAECPNACSGHGDCKNKDQCECYDGFYGGDCSLRVCPLGNSFVDAPLGDLNHAGGATVDGYSQVQGLQAPRYKQYESWPSSASSGGWAAQAGEAHYQVECSGKGSCNRALGVCKCFDGFTGAACQRTTCPSDCSGHGMCVTVGEVAESGAKSFVKSQYGVSTYAGVLTAAHYHLWDEKKNTACMCDTGYSGIDCSLRECPRGDDPLTFDDASCGGKACTAEVQSFSVDGGQTAGTYYLLFTDFDGTQYKTNTFALDTQGSAAGHAKNVAAVKAALEGLPNGVTGNVVVTSDGGANPFGPACISPPCPADKFQARVSVKFSGKSGNLPAMVLGWESGKHAYVFQPGQPTHTFDLNSVTGSHKFQAQLTPSDTSLAPVLSSRADKWVYWTTPDSDAALLSAATESDVGAAVATSLNKIPMVDFAYPNAFRADSNVVVRARTFGSTGPPFTVTVAFPDQLTGALPFLYAVGPSTPLTLTTSSQLLLRDGASDNSNGNYEAVTCSNRGLCDFGTGLCKCFAGHTGVDCSQQSALARGDGNTVKA